MTIGIDISQLAFINTGVGNYLLNFVESLIQIDNRNDYVLFYSSLRRPLDELIIKRFQKPNVFIVQARFPSSFLDLIWNKIHVMDIRWFVGDVDVFISSDWTEPPAKYAKKATIIYDLATYKYPSETDKKIVETQKRKLKWVKKESDIVFCISEATKKDVREILGIEEKRLKVVYPGIM